MGLFDKLFKKNCDICGGDIGLLGNKKLEDGNCCKKCAAKLSPWFTDRKESTVEEIKAQLAYREENLAVLNSLTITGEYGNDAKVCIDETQQKFFVSRRGDYTGENCDVLDFSQVKSVEFNLEEDASEEFYTDDNGEQQSYKPRAYIFSYSASMTINVEHPYFDSMRFDLSPSDFTLNPDNPLPKISKPDPMTNAEYVEYLNMGNRIRSILLGMEYSEV